MYRILTPNLEEKTSKVRVLLGPRQVGKTTLLKSSFPEGTYLNLERSNFIEVFNSRDIQQIKDLG